MGNKISHTGIVENVTEGCVKVRIVQSSACVACKVASHCNAADSKVKIVDVFCCDTSEYSVGQNVIVSASTDVANKALLLGFGIPFLLLICVLLITLRLTNEEGFAALVAVGSLVPYYFIIWLMRDKIQQRISFQIEYE